MAGNRRSRIVRIVALAVLGAIIILGFGLVLRACAPHEQVTVGFIFDNDEKTPYSYDFYMSQETLQKAYGDDVRILMYSNVLDENIRTVAEHLSNNGCKVIFTNSYGNLLSLTREHPDVQYCQVSSELIFEEAPPENYHTFKGEAYQGRYLSGVVAGLKLEEMIRTGSINKDDMQVGFVAAFPSSEVISGYTAFLLGVRSVVDTATMRVKYTYSWSDYIMEKACATELLNDGCTIISQHTDTIGPAVACEEYYARDVYHVGYNIDMTDVAPDVSLTSVRINWTPYLLGSMQAVLSHQRIEDTVTGTVHGFNDMSGGLSDGWVELTPLNDAILPDGVQSTVDTISKGLIDGSVHVFYGPYTGTNPDDPTDTIDLSTPYTENENSSIPSFHYLLDDIVTVEE